MTTSTSQTSAQTSAQNIAREIARQGAARFASWDDALFGAFADTLGRRLSAALEGAPDAASVVEGYLHLVAEAIGQGYITQPPEARHNQYAAPGGLPVFAKTANFLTLCFTEFLPTRLPEVPAGRRLEVLVDTWNICEGLLGEPSWLDAYVRSCAEKFRRIENLAGWLAQVLEPALSPPRQGIWHGPLSLEILEPHRFDYDFLPGPMQLVAPGVVCITDRLRPNVHLAVFVGRGEKPRILGPTEPSSAYAPSDDTPTVVLADSELRVERERLHLPYLDHLHQKVVSDAGFVVASAVDSQRLWIAECA